MNKYFVEDHEQLVYKKVALDMNNYFMEKLRRTGAAIL